MRVGLGLPLALVGVAAVWGGSGGEPVTVRCSSFVTVTEGGGGGGGCSRSAREVCPATAPATDVELRMVQGTRTWSLGRVWRRRDRGGRLDGAGAGHHGPRAGTPR